MSSCERAPAVPVALICRPHETTTFPITTQQQQPQCHVISFKKKTIKNNGIVSTCIGEVFVVRTNERLRAESDGLSPHDPAQPSSTDGVGSSCAVLPERHGEDNYCKHVCAPSADACGADPCAVAVVQSSRQTADGSVGKRYVGSMR